MVFETFILEWYYRINCILIGSPVFLNLLFNFFMEEFTLENDVLRFKLKKSWNLRKWNFLS